MKEKAIALALSLALMLTIFVPGTLAMGTESGKDANTASQQVSVPQKTETPSEAVDPADPSDPSDPVKPVDPSNPSTPTEEGKPVETTAPTEEGKPTETTAPTEEGKPTETTAPTEEGKPAETTAPTEESKPDETTAPTEESKPTDIMPQIMAMIQQDILAGEPEMIDAKWFSFGGATKPDGFPGVQSGHISRNTVPEIDGHVYAGAYYHNAQVDIIGQITYQDKTYVYFVPVGGNTELVSQVLKDGDTIELRYTETPLNISYAVTVDGEALPVNEDGSIVMEGIPYGGNTSQKVTVISAGSPHAVTPNGEFSFGVEIPRGYTATVSVNNTPDSVKLGVSPEYTLDGDTIVKNGEYLTSHTYTANATDNGEQSVTVTITTDNTHTFSADLISKTKYFTDDKGNPGDRVYQSNIGDSALEDVKYFSGPVSGDHVTWNFETDRNRTGPILWYLDSLQLNGTDITVPFANDVPKSTTLPSGAVVTVTRVEHEETYGSWPFQSRGYRHYAYTITITNVHEDIVVTGGNLCGTAHNEYMPYAFTGVGVLEYQNGGGWEPMSIAQPVAADQITSGNFRFTLKGGYGAPTFTVNDHEYPATLNNDGYYYVNNVNPSSYPALIVVDSKEVEVKVEYVAGEVTGAENLPTDGNTYSLAEGYPHEITIPLRTPTDPTGKMVFAGWMNGTGTYQRNAVVSLIDTDERDGVVTFTAKWIDAATADYVTYHIHYVDSDTNAIVAESAVSQALKDTAVILNVEQGSIHTWLMNNPQYEVDNRTQFYYEKIDNNDILTLYVKEKTATITYQAVGPEGATSFGSVTPASEEVKISSGTAQGSTPEAKPGFRFVGWYTDAGCTMEVDETWVEANNMLIPKKTDEMWEAATYYAKFDYAYADLTITATGIANTYGQQGTIYQVDVKPADGTPEFNFQIAINGNDSKTITDLPYGEYTVTPQNNWSWRYSDQTGTTVQPSEGNDGRMVASATFRYSLVDQKWLSGNAYYGN